MKDERLEAAVAANDEDVCQFLDDELDEEDEDESLIFFNEIDEAANAAYENGDFDKADELFAEISDIDYSRTRRAQNSLMDDIWNGRSI